MRDTRQELADLVDLLDEVDARADALDAGTDPAPTDGPAPDEERAVQTARARLAARRAREMRERLTTIRTRARTLAGEAREMVGRDPDGDAGAHRALAAAGSATWAAVERAGAVLARTRPDDAPEVLRRCREAARIAVPGARWTALVAREGDGRPRVEAGDDVLADLVGSDESLVAALPAEAGTVELAVAVPAPGARAVAAGVGGLLVVHLPTLPAERLDPSGSWPVALVLGALRADGFGPAERTAARAVAVQIALLLTAARRVQGLYLALEGRDVIGQAKGIIMHRDGVDADVAFRRLVEASQYANLKLAAVAQWLVDETRQARSVSLGEHP